MRCSCLFRQYDIHLLRLCMPHRCAHLMKFSFVSVIHLFDVCRYSGRAVAAATPSTFARLMQVPVHFPSPHFIIMIIYFALPPHPPPPCCRARKRRRKKLKRNRPFPRAVECLDQMQLHLCCYLLALRSANEFSPRLVTSVKSHRFSLFRFRGLSNIARRKPAAARIPLPFGTSSISVSALQRAQSAGAHGRSPALHPGQSSTHKPPCSPQFYAIIGAISSNHKLKCNTVKNRHLPHTLKRFARHCSHVLDYRWFASRHSLSCGQGARDAGRRLQRRQ